VLTHEVIVEKRGDNYGRAMPFAGYRDFDDCVAKNQDKADPEAYCGSIQHRVEAATFATDRGPQDGDWVRARPMAMEDSANVIVGGAPSPAPVTGLLTIVRSKVPGVSRHSVAGLTVDPATITVVAPPSQ
jgi:hypothetical protein